MRSSIDRLAFTFVTLFAWLLAAQPAVSQIKPKVIKSGKAATALVVLPSGQGFGTAFCIDAEGYFLTNEHVVRSTQGAKSKLVLHPGEKGEQAVEAIVVRTDKDADVALLKSVAAGKFTALKLGDVQGLIETQELVAFGYPFGTALKVKQQQYPNVSVNVGRITALRKSNGKLEQIQLDAQLNHGNSGGPVVDGKGEVVGVVRAGLRNSGVNFAIPVSQVRTFLDSPEIGFAPPDISYARRYEPISLAVGVTTFLPGARNFGVQIVLDNPRGRQRRLMLKPGDDGTHRVSAAVLQKPDGKFRLPIDITFTNGLIRGEVEDAALKIGKGIARLRDVRSIQRQNDQWVIVAKDGQQQTVAALKQQEFTVYVGGSPLTVDLENAEAITIYQLPRETQSVAYTVEVRREGELIASKSGKIQITDVPAPPRTQGDIALAKATQRYRPPQEKIRFDEEHLVTRLPEPYAAYTLGGTGRFMVFHLKESKTVAVLDLLSGRIVHEIEDISDDVLLAAGAEKLLLVIPSQKLIQRWSLATFQREKMGRLPGEGTTRSALMGCNGTGPLLLAAENATLLDVETMEPIAVDGKVIGGGRTKPFPSTRISADGLTVGSIPTGYGPVAYARMQIDGRRTKVDSFGSTSYAMRWAQPTAAGTLMLLRDGVYSAHLEKIDAKWLDGMFTLPTVDPRYFLAATFKDGERGKAMTHLNFCTVADRKIVYTLVGLEELGPTGNTNQRSSHWGRHLNNGEQLIHWIPWANLLVTLEYDKQKIHLRRFDLLQALGKPDMDYVFVDSIPPATAYRGDTLEYQISARSNSPDVKYKLASGPEGLSVSQAGKVQWRVPADSAERWSQVIVSVTNAVGKEAFHSFRLKIADVDRVIDAAGQ